MKQNDVKHGEQGDSKASAGEKIIYPVRLDVEDYRRVQRIGRAEDRSAGYLIRRALREWLQRAD